MQNEYTLQPQRQEIALVIGIGGHDVIYSYVFACISVSLVRIMVTGGFGGSGSANLMGSIGILVTGVFALMIPLAYLLAIAISYYSKFAAIRISKKYLLSFLIINDRFCFSIRGEPRLSVSLKEMEEICLVKKHDSVLKKGSGIGIRFTQSTLDLLQDKRLRSMFEYNLRRNGYHIWLFSALIGRQNQVFEFWEWIKTRASGVQIREISTPPRRAERPVTSGDWLMVVIATIWVILTFLHD